MIGRHRSADGGTSRGFDPNVRIRVNGGGAGAAPPPPPGLLVPMQAHVLDRYQPRFGILNCLYGAQVMHSEDMAAVLWRAPGR